MSSKRAGAITSAILMLISASFAFIAGLIYIMSGIWFEDLWVGLGIMCFISFSLAIVGTVAIVRRIWPLVPLAADALLIACAVLSLMDMMGISIVILVLAIVAIVLLAASWGQFKELRNMQYPMPMGMPPQAMGMPPQAMGMPPQAMGMPPPAIGGPPMAMGASSPTMAPVEGGAPPPRPIELDDDEPIVAYVGSEEP
jgi:hypothetical protein